MTNSLPKKSTHIGRLRLLLLPYRASHDRKDITIKENPDYVRNNQDKRFNILLLSRSFKILTETFEFKSQQTSLRIP